MEMTWREKTVVQILILIAKMVSSDESVRKDLETLRIHVSLGLGETR